MLTRDANFFYSNAWNTPRFFCVSSFVFCVGCSTGFRWKTDSSGIKERVCVWFNRNLYSVCYISYKERRCDIGFTLTRQKCTDIDECKEFPGLCEGKLHCTNTVGSFVCGCWSGYETIITDDFDLMMRIPDCVDIDECLKRKTCPDNSVCQNTAGNFTCQCKNGFDGDLCEDIDECFQSGSCHANATCSNTEGSYLCACNRGHRGDGKSCKIGECDDRRCPSDQKCKSSTSNECECNQGLRFDVKLDLCQDIDECSVGHTCDKNAVCDNTRGSYSCKCNDAFFGNGQTCLRRTTRTETTTTTTALMTETTKNTTSFSKRIC